jgi:hypothetical protein
MPLAFLMHDPLAGILMLLALLWLSAKVGGELAIRLRLPAVTEAGLKKDGTTFED